MLKAADLSQGRTWVADRGGLAAGAIGYKAQQQASEARRSAKQPFAPTIGFAGLCGSFLRCSVPRFGTP
jgi:hypothetical protein